MKRRHPKRVSYSFQDLDRVVKESGLHLRECSSTHWQIVLPDGQLNIWPTTSKGMLDIQGDRSTVDISSLDRIRNLISGKRSEPAKQPERLTVALRIAAALERIADALEKQPVPY